MATEKKEPQTPWEAAAMAGSSVEVAEPLDAPTPWGAAQEAQVQQQEQKKSIFKNVQDVAAAYPEAAQKLMMALPEVPSMIAGIPKAFTGEERMTEEIERLPEIGDAPEIGGLGLRDLQIAWGLMATGDPEKAQGILQKNLPEAEFRKDEKSNIIVSLPSGEYSINRPGFSGQDIPAAVSDALLFGKAALVRGLTKKLGLGSAIELGKQVSVEELGGGEVDPEEAATAGILQLIPGGAKKTGEIATTKAPEELVEIAETGKEMGVPVMTTDVVPPETLVGKQARAAGEFIPIAGTGGTRAAQQLAREESVDAFVQSFDVNLDSNLMKEVIKDVGDYKGSRFKEANELRRGAEAQLDTFGLVERANLNSAINTEINRLQRKLRPTPDDYDAIKKLQELKAAPLGSFSDTKTLRTDLGEYIEQAKSGTTPLTGSDEAMYRRVYGALTKDMEDFAKSGDRGGPRRQAGADWFKSNKIYSDEYFKYKETTLKNILRKGDINEEVLEPIIKGNKPSDVRLLWSNTTPEGKAKVRGAVIQRAYNRSKDVYGNPDPDKFVKELDRMGNTTNVFFQGQDERVLNGYKKLINHTRRSRDAAVQTPTGRELQLGAVGAGGLAGAHFIGSLETALIGGGVGGAARLYESPPVRNAMLRLSAAKMGGSEYQAAIDAATQALAGVVQQYEAEE